MFYVVSALNSDCVWEALNIRNYKHSNMAFMSTHNLYYWVLVFLILLNVPCLKQNSIVFKIFLFMDPTS